MVKKGGFGLGPSGPSPDDIAREAAAELRRAMAGSQQRSQFPGAGMPSDWIAEDTEPSEPGGSEWHNGLTRDEERRAVTDLAMQQLAERPFGTIRPEDTLPSTNGLDAEDMRNRALAQFLDRQKRMAKEHPVPPPPTGRAGQAIVQRTSGMTVSPQLTVKPTLTSSRPPFGPDSESGTEPELRLTPPDRTVPRRSDRMPARLDPRPARRDPRPARLDRAPEQSERGDRPWPDPEPVSPPRLGPLGRPVPDEPDPARSAAHEGVAASEPSARPAVWGPASGATVWDRPVKPPRAAQVPRWPDAAAPVARSAPGPAPEPDEPLESDPMPPRPSPMATPAVRSRPIQRRPSPRSTPASPDRDGRWRVLAELADVLGAEIFPGDALPQIARWLAGTTGTTVAILMLADDAVDDVVAWPDDVPVAADLAALVGQPLDERSTIWLAVHEGRTIAGHPDEDIVMPDGVLAERGGGWAAIPIVDRDAAFGVLLLLDADSDSLAEVTVSLVEEVTQRVARALFNCEEVAIAGARPEGGLPPIVRDRLGALAFVLEALDASPATRLAPEDERQYAAIAHQAAKLRDQVTRLLHGTDGR